jgi:hypothetical protein
MSLWLAFALVVAFLVLIEVLNLFLGLWSDRATEWWLRMRRRASRQRFPWSDRTGT